MRAGADPLLQAHDSVRHAGQWLAEAEKEREQMRFQLAAVTASNPALLNLVEMQRIDAKLAEVTAMTEHLSGLVAKAAQRDIERCAHILELASIAEEFANVGVDVAKKRRVVAIRKTVEP